MFKNTGPIEDRESYQEWYEANSHYSNHKVTKDYARIYWLLPYIKGHILEIGCQTGGVTRIVANLGKTTSITAIDITEESIKKTKESLLTHPRPRLAEKAKLYKCYVEDFTSDTKYDSILLMEVLEHVLDPVVVLEKCLSMLPTNGTIIISVPEDDAFPEPDHLRDYTHKSLYSDIIDALSSLHIEITIQMIRTCSPWFDIDKYSWILATVTRDK